MALRMGAYLRATFPDLRIEPTSRRIRCTIDATTVGDTIRGMVVWEPRRVVPVYAVPERDFGAFSWRDEDDPVIGHPHDPFKRIDVLHSRRHVVVSLDGVTLADSTSPVALLETLLPTRWYLPPENLRMDLLTPSDTRTICSYKGHASYLSVTDGGEPGRDLAWTYPDPLHEAAQVRGRVAFFSERCDISVDGVPIGRPVTPWSSPEEQRRGLDFP